MNTQNKKAEAYSLLVEINETMLKLNSLLWLLQKNEMVNWETIEFDHVTQLSKNLQSAREQIQKY